MRKRILYFGCYEPLAETRKLLLQNAGTDVACATDTAEAARIVGDGDVALVLVCNSCDDESYANLLNALRPASPSIPIVRLDERFPVAWRDPELISSLVRAALRQNAQSGNGKPPQPD